MPGEKLQSIGGHALTIALLALAAMVYMAAVISGPQPSSVLKPVPQSDPAVHDTPAKDLSAEKDPACLHGLFRTAQDDGSKPTVMVADGGLSPQDVTLPLPRIMRTAGAPAIAHNTSP